MRRKLYAMMNNVCNLFVLGFDLLYNKVQSNANGAEMMNFAIKREIVHLKREIVYQKRRNLN